MSLSNGELYEFGDFRVDVGERKIESVSGRRTGTLREKPFQTLVHLLRNSGRLVTKQELLSAVWPDSIVEEGNLGKAIYSIRRFLGETSAETTYIETVPKHGYRFIAPVRALFSEESVSETPASEPNGAAAGVTGAEKSEPARVAQSAGVNRSKVNNGEQGDFRPAAANLHIPDHAAGIQGATLVLLTVIVFVIGGWLTGLLPVAGLNSRPEAPRGERGTSPAYDLYIRGKVKVAAENREDTESAVRVLEEAVALDPGFAPAFAQLARAYNTMAFKYASGDERKRYHEDAEVAIEKALALDPNLAEAHFARGLVLWSDIEGFPHEQVVKSYKRSIELDPGIDETHHQLSLVYSHIGLAHDALQSVERALELNPKNTLARYRSGVYAQYQGRFEDSLAVHKTIPRDFTPLLVERTTAEVLIQMGRTAEAERIVDDYLTKFPQDEGGSFTSVRALLLAKEGRVQESEAAIRRAVEIGSGFGHFHHTAYNIASANASMNRPAEAVKWLEQAAENGFPNYTYFEVDPNLDAIRGDVRFIDFMAKLRSRWEGFRVLNS